MSVDSDTEGGVGLIDDNDNYEKSNNRLREREPNKIYADSQLANAAAAGEREVNIYNEEDQKKMQMRVAALPVVVVVVLTLCPRRLPLRKKTKVRKFYKPRSIPTFSRWKISTPLSRHIIHIGTCEVTKVTIQRRCSRA